MKSHWCLAIGLLIAVAAYFISGLIVDPNWKIYYDLRTNRTLDPIDTSNPRLKIYKYKYKSELRRLRIGFGPIPCSCQELTCGCCGGMNISMFNFDRRACLNFTYDPQEFAINMDMFMNDQNLYSNSISGKNPPPVCMPVPVPYVPSMDFCLRFFNVHTSGYNVFTCLDFETRIERAPILVLHFDCLQMGQDGISYHKPDEDDLEMEYPPDQQEDEQSEFYDEVIEEAENGTSANKNFTQPNKSVLKGDSSSIDEVRIHQTEVYDDVLEDEERMSGANGAGSDETLATTEKITTPLVVQNGSSLEKKKTTSL